MMDDNNDRPTLDYGRPDYVSRGDMAVNGTYMVLGLITGVVGITMAGCGVFNIVGYPYIAGPNLPASRPFAAYVYGGLFWALTAATVIGLIWMLYTRRRRWFVMGLCCGVGVMALVEGLCFIKG